jgi:site-specific DNA-methyltransferase (adenine-specific)
MVPENTIIEGDCMEVLRDLYEKNGRRPFADLVFADPPFNIGYRYDVYEDNMKYEQYCQWTAGWMKVCCEVLKRHGSFWVAIGDEYAAEIRIAARNLGLFMRNWIIWYYTFGQSARRKFGRSHTHILYFVKDKDDFVFNDEAVRVPSARQTTYNDKRANPKGKVPDDTWILRPRDAAGIFDPGDDTWNASRVCGTFRERTGFHGCQMPVKVLQRIIAVATDRGHFVLDPFSGSGTTVAVARCLGRRYLGIDISGNYVAVGKARLKESGMLFDYA